MNEKQQSTLRKIARRDISVPKEWLRIVGKPENETREDFIFAPVPTVLKLVELGYLERRSKVPYLSVKVTPDGANWIWQNAPHIFADVINGSAIPSSALTDAESIANTEQHARSIPHAIEATIDAYMVAVDPSEVEELIQLQADKEQIALEIQEAEESAPSPALTRPNAPVSGGQINAINVLITRHCVGHRREWFTHFTKSILGRHVASPGKLTASEAQQIEMAIQQIARKRCYPGDLLTADLDLDFTLKFDCFPEDWERAKAEIAEVTREATLEVSKMRTSNPRYLTKAEAICYSTKLFKLAETYRKHAAETVTVQG